MGADGKKYSSMCKMRAAGVMPATGAQVRATRKRAQAMKKRVTKTRKTIKKRPSRARVSFRRRAMDPNDPMSPGALSYFRRTTSS